MAWVKMKSTEGIILNIPETVYNNMYKGNEAFSLVDEPKPLPKFSEENKNTEEVANDRRESESGRDSGGGESRDTRSARDSRDTRGGEDSDGTTKTNTTRKSTKKAINESTEL